MKDNRQKFKNVFENICHFNTNLKNVYCASVASVQLEFFFFFFMKMGNTFARRKTNQIDYLLTDSR